MTREWRGGVLWVNGLPLDPHPEIDALERECQVGPYAREGGKVVDKAGELARICD